MIRDYAKKTDYYSPPKKGNSALIILVIAIAMLAPLFLFYSRFHTIIHNKGRAVSKQTSQQLNNVVPHNVVPPKKESRGERITDTTENTPLPEYDFYTMLPKMDVPPS